MTFRETLVVLCLKNYLTTKSSGVEMTACSTVLASRSAALQHSALRHVASVGVTVQNRHVHIPASARTRRESEDKLSTEHASLRWVMSHRKFTTENVTMIDNLICQLAQ